MNISDLFTDFFTLFHRPSFLGFFVAVAIITVVELVMLYFRYKNKLWYKQTRKNIDNPLDVEQISLQYYRNTQIYNGIRFATIMIGVFLVILMYDTKVFSVFAIVLGAIIVLLKDIILSFLSYLFVISQFTIGDDIRLHGYFGEIVKIKPLFTALLGKDDEGQYNGKLVQVPNYIFIQNEIERHTLKVETPRLHSLLVAYKPSKFNNNFDEFVIKLDALLDAQLPVPSLYDVMHYRSFAGIAYQQQFDYTKDGDIHIVVQFVAKQNEGVQHKSNIIREIEKLALPQSQK